MNEVQQGSIAQSVLRNRILHAGVLLLKMAEGGGTMFSVELLDGGGCRFSDSEERGSWQAREAFVVIEKPKGAARPP